MRTLNYEEQVILKYIMQKKNLSQGEIARRNYLASTTNIWGVCKGKVKVSPVMKKHFANCGIDLDDVMRFSDPRPYKIGRILTEEEAKVLKQKCKRLHLTQKSIAEKNYTSRSFINAVFRRRYKVTDVIKKHFLECGIDIEEIMGEKNV